MGRRKTAANVAGQKRKHPENFCPTRDCLWRTGDGSYCPRHWRMGRVVFHLDGNPRNNDPANLRIETLKENR